MIAWKLLNQERKSVLVSDPQYVLTYKKGKITKSVPNTLGIFCFKTKKDANMYGVPQDLIVKVEGINQQPLPRLIPFRDDAALFYMTKEEYAQQMPPTGTVLFEKVKVLE